MNDSDLDELLKAASVPERAPEFWAQLPGRIGAKLRWQQRRGDKVNLPSRPNAAMLWGWGLTGAAVFILMGFLMGQRQGARQMTSFVQNEKLLHEVLATFPNQVRAIVQDENGLHLSLADEPNVPQSQPLWIKVCQGGVCRSIVTFSGQVVEIADKQVEVLADARGGVMLVGEHFFWSSWEGGAGGQMQIKAQTLNYML